MTDLEQSGMEFLDRWALTVLSHKFLYLLVALAVAGGYIAREFSTARPCRTSWLIRTSADPVAMQAVSVALGTGLQTAKKGGDFVQITAWGSGEMCGLAMVDRVAAEARQYFGVTTLMVGEATTDYSRLRVGPVVGRAALAAIMIVGILAFGADATKRAWRHLMRLNDIAAVGADRDPPLR